MRRERRRTPGCRGTVVAALSARARAAVLKAPRDAGMSTAEYAVGTVAACGFAAVLYKIVTSGAISSALEQLIERALGAQF